MSTHNTCIPFSIYKKKITLSCPKSGAMGFFQGTQERVRNSCGKRPSVFEPLKFYCIFQAGCLISTSAVQQINLSASFR